LRSRAVRSQVGDQRTRSVLQLEAVRDLLRDRLDLDAQPATRDRSVILELVDHALCGRGRDGEGDADAAAGRREDGGVDADDLTPVVAGWAAGVAAVHGCVDLQEVVARAGADVAAARCDDARSS